MIKPPAESVPLSAVAIVIRMVAKPTNKIRTIRKRNVIALGGSQVFLRFFGGMCFALGP